MSGAAAGRPAPAASWDLDVEAGDPVEIFSRPYVFERVDADGVVTFRAPAGSSDGDFMVQETDGRVRKPVVYEVLALMQDDTLVWREKPLSKESRRLARAKELDAQQARAMDPVAEFRMAIVRRFDGTPWAKSDSSLRLFIQDALDDPAIAALPGAWAACPATIRTWLNDRGTEGCRKERDGVSMKNRMPRVRKLNHPIEIVLYHALRAENVRGSRTMNHENYVAEIEKINTGEALARNLLDLDTITVSGRTADYPVPAKPYEAMPYLRFWRLCRKLRGEGAYGRKTTRQAAYHRYGGGGLSDLPTHVGALCWIDSTPVPKAFFVDDETGIPVGECSMTLMHEHRSKVVPGWDLCPGACNSSAVLRTVLCANQVKDVPEHLLRIDPNLPYIRLRPDKIGFDNATENHGRTVEQNLDDAYIRTDFVGSKMPRDKSVQERVIGTFLDLLFKHQADANYDIARMRLYGFDPEEAGHVLCSIETGRRLLALAVMTHNVTRHRGLDNRQPALVWKQLLGTRKLNVLKNVDEFKRGIGIVGEATMSPAGFEKFNRRYTAGALEMRRIVQDFERADRVAKGDIGRKPRKNSDDRKRPTWKVRIRFDENDIGVVRVWNPHAIPTAKWEDFNCTEPTAYGMPLWLHKRCLEIAERDAMDYLTPRGQAVVRAKLFEEIANVDSNSAERDRLALGRALAEPHTRRVASAYVHVVNEPVVTPVQPEPEEHAPAMHGMSRGARKDADIDTPRSAPPPPKEPIKVRPASASTRGVMPPPAASAAAAAPAAGPAPATAPRHRKTTTKSKNDARRGATAPTKSADRPDQRAPSRARSNRLKYGDEY